MDRLRIAMFSDSAFPILNGVSVSVHGLVDELRNQGHSVHLYAPRHPGHRELDPNTFRFRSLATPWKLDYPVPCPPYYRMLLQFREHEYDLIHTHSPFISGLIGLRWGESHNLPVVTTYHTLYDRYAHYVRCLPRRYARFRIAKHTNFYYNGVDHVITPSDISMKWLRRHSVSTPMTVIPTGSPAARPLDRLVERQRLGIPPKAKIMLYVGRLAKEKNLTTLLEMASLTFKQDPSLRLWLVGDGPYRHELKSIARRMGIGDRVRFVGFVERDQVDSFYAAADLFVFPSYTETQGLVVQEAMIYGLPAVVVDGGGASAAVEPGQNGFIVKNAAEDFASHVLSLTQNDQLYAELSSGATRTIRNCGMAQMTDRVLQVYRSTVECHQEVSNDHFAWI